MHPEGETDAVPAPEPQRQTLVGGGQLGDSYHGDLEGTRRVEHMQRPRVAVEMAVTVNESNVSQGG
jgi:hypothetical protein